MVAVDLPADLADTLRARSCGWVWLGVFEPSDQLQTFDAVAEAAGLSPLGPAWHEVDRVGAKRILESLLHRGLAYRSELMPAPEAARLAEQLLDSIAGSGPRFATNTLGVPGENGSSWNPATPHTFDAGLVAMAAEGAIVYWVADED